MKTEKECLQYLYDLNLPQLSNQDRNSCEGLLTKKECWDSLNAMKNGKSPGNDGLSKEFYVCFFNELSDSIIMALNTSFEVAQLSKSQCQAIITLIEKKDKDNRLMKNWRPISLINVDAKIALKAIATRMKNVLSNIVKYDQTAYVKGRYIGESIHLISDILDYTENNDVPGVLFSAYFEKAFNSVEHNFIFAVLKSFGFGSRFIQWVRTFLKNAESCVLNNGHSTGYFMLERGARQGNPSTAYLFILCVETLFVQIRNNDDIKGVRLGDHEIKLSAYADDSDFFTSDVRSLVLIFQTCETFQLYSSPKLNLEKSEPCWIGAKWGPKETPINCKWIDLNCNAIRTLGILTAISWKSQFLRQPEMLERSAESLGI